MSKCVRVAWLGLAMLSAITSAQTTNVTNSNNGTTNTVPIFTGSSTVGNSPISISASNVGIGTTSPVNLLHVYGSIGPRMVVQNTTNGANVGYQLFVNDSTNGLERLGVYGVPANPANQRYIGLSANDANYQMTIRADGNVGIGTTAPLFTLDVNGVINSSSGVRFPDGKTQTIAYTASSAARNGAFNYPF